MIGTKGRRSSFLQIIALAAMFVDHAGAILFPEDVYMRIIGRMALPVFAYSVAEGCRVTRDISKYYTRMLVLALLSQFPYLVALGHGMRLNICFSLSITILVIYAFQTGKYYIALLFLAVIPLINLEYSIYSPAMILTYHFLRDTRLLKVSILSVLTLIYSYSTGYTLQIAAIPAFFIIEYLPELKERVSMPRMAFYWFYPLHFLLLVVIQEVSTGGARTTLVVNRALAFLTPGAF